MNNPYAIHPDQPVSTLPVEARAAFITRTYGHLVGALIGFTLIEIALFQSGLAARMASVMLGGPWLLFLGAFMVVGMLASNFAHKATSPGAQYAALVGYVVAEALLFVPLLFIANQYAPGTIASAGVVSLGAFAALSLVAFLTRKDFSFLRGIVMWGGICALLAIVAGAIFGFHLGVGFSALMVLLAGASILYQTSNVLHHYPEDRHVAASLELFASVALLFWYVLRLFLAARD